MRVGRGAGGDGVCEVEKKEKEGEKMEGMHCLISGRTFEGGRGRVEGWMLSRLTLSASKNSSDQICSYMPLMVVSVRMFKSLHIVCGKREFILCGPVPLFS